MNRVLPLTFLLLLTVSAAQAEGVGILQTLAQCLPSYFAKVGASQEIRSANYRFTSSNRLLVKNHRDELDLDYVTMGSKPVQLDGLDVVGLYDQHRKANTFEALDWGVLVQGDPESIAAKINQLIPGTHKLESDGLFGYARLNRTTLADWPKWTTVFPLPPEAMPESGHIEMVSVVTIADETLPGISKIGCSVQGVFPPFVLKATRPDIE